ncbi:hypothetical protein HYO65_gp172 [Tenacibaculum phage PTm1]|uniref:Uncharacterized protein n=2 Tax=Shirahamavirus PTm1 TaxID=2846435 RepID=A0A5S9C149_9CAUD|nr:hypothetical protein HYO65_gp172 [Tenacibaculum phage PTm1]BBI90564.1 hypothetical protein [Tenacibaculum phage PTm1]BBI90872.1 hypothetical protein [Tenacibaculum phage PTm5]
MDFNSRDINQPHVSKEPVIDEMLALFLQELDILFKTPKNHVFGNRDFGQSTEKLLWSTKFNDEYMKVSIAEDIRKSCYMNEYFSWTVDVKLLTGTVRDIALIDVVIRDKHDDSELATKKFQFR